MDTIEVEKNCNYEAAIQLSGVQAFATNDMVAAKLKEVGFINVQVHGYGTKRKATGHWPREHSRANKPPEILSIKKI